MISFGASPYRCGADACVILDWGRLVSLEPGHVRGTLLRWGKSSAGLPTRRLRDADPRARSIHQPFLLDGFGPPRPAVCPERTARVRQPRGWRTSEVRPGRGVDTLLSCRVPMTWKEPLHLYRSRGCDPTRSRCVVAYKALHSLASQQGCVNTRPCWGCAKVVLTRTPGLCDGRAGLGCR